VIVGGLAAAVLSIVAVPGSVSAQLEDLGGGVEADEVRIVARRLADGRVEFGLQQRSDSDGSWSSRRLPSRRFFPLSAEVGRWLGSSPLSLTLSLYVILTAPDSMDEATNTIEVRIVARRLGDGRVEFGLQQRLGDGSWSDRQLPRVRMFPAHAPTGMWLVSSSLPPYVSRPDEEVPWSPEPEAPDSDAPWSPEPEVPEPEAPEPEARSARGPVLREVAPRGVGSVFSGLGLSCGVRFDARVVCWGRFGLVNQLAASGLRDVVSLSISRTASVGDGPWATPYVCALHGDGGVSCWGWSQDGEIDQLGRLGWSRRHLPARVRGIDGARMVAVGQSHACVVHADGGVSCWGTYPVGPVAAGQEHDVSLPRRVPGLRDVTSLAASTNGVCAVHAGGAVTCWSPGSPPAPGSVSTDGTPVRVAGLGDVASLSLAVGSRYDEDSTAEESCAVHFDGQVSCWTAESGPYRVPGLVDVVAVSAGYGNVCALHRDGGVSCWGSNRDGELGDGTRSFRSTPARVVGVTGATWVAAGHGADDTYHGASFLGAHACAALGDGSVSCWGGNSLGQLGDGTKTSRSEPVRVSKGWDVPNVQIPSTETDLLRTWGDTLIADHESAWPWLGAAWDHIRGSASMDPRSPLGGFVSVYCDMAGDVLYCGAREMVMTSLGFDTLVHELGHVFDGVTGMAPNPRAWGAVQLYFSTTYPDCRPGELLADTLEYLVDPLGWLTYYNSALLDPERCPGVSATPSPEALEVVRDGLAGRVPRWYLDNFTNGADLWSAIRGGNVTGLLANGLGDEFGGLCSTEWLRELVQTGRLDSGGVPPAGANPFRDGGCRS
jgi:hypothetical protein